MTLGDLQIKKTKKHHNMAKVLSTLRGSIKTYFPIKHILKEPAKHHIPRTRTILTAYRLLANEISEDLLFQMAGTMTEKIPILSPAR